MTHDHSRRTLILGVGALAVATSTGSGALAKPSAAGPWVARIGVASPEAVAQVGAQLGARPRPVPTRHLSPGHRAASFGLAGVDVEFEDSDPASHALAGQGGRVGLVAQDPDRIAARARQAGLRVFRDWMVAGQRVIELDPGPLGARFEIVGILAPEAVCAPTRVTGVVVACADPQRAAALAGAIFEAPVQDAVANLAGFPVRFVQSAPADRKGVVALNLADARRREVRV
ncbi:MAG: hypothetical protein MH112_06475 [Phenylobacterium sp.]|uniref:hypothetical protein n=1 Tax=Phenylobacterium sp. TaxID=1871053 RepID=UPI0025E5007C|nr:hypothetical protein [Phenylobacterium sp.]MCG9915992.1 hypothetical protein [Phenylobacterium sp.]